jgi:hypothetical protein
MQIVSFVRDMGAARADTDETSVLQLEVGNDVFHDGATSNRPRLSLLVVGVHVPFFESFKARPQADLVVPGGISGMDPPSEVQKTWQRLQLIAHLAK